MSQSIEGLTRLGSYEEVQAYYAYLPDAFFHAMDEAYPMLGTLRHDKLNELVMPISQEEINSMFIPGDFVQQVNRFFARMFEIQQLSKEDSDSLIEFVKRVLLRPMFQQILDAHIRYEISGPLWRTEIKTIEDLKEAGLFEEFVREYEPIVLEEYENMIIKNAQKSGRRKPPSLLELIHLISYDDINRPYDELEVPELHHQLRKSAISILMKHYYPDRRPSMSEYDYLDEWCSNSVTFFYVNVIFELERQGKFKEFWNRSDKKPSRK